MKKVIILGLGVFFYTNLSAQSSVNVSGAEVKNQTGSISNSIGQVFYTSSQNSKGGISQGVQQTYIISTLSNQQIEKEIDLATFPNPVQGMLNLRVSDFKSSELKYRLIDQTGKSVSEGSINQYESKIDMHSLEPTTYFCEVISGNEIVKSFKIVKN